MLFNSVEFLIFLPIVICLYFVIEHKYRHFLLLLASYYFYMKWNPTYALLILFSTIVTYFSGIIIDYIRSNHKISKDKYIKLCVVISMTMNLLVLFYFKYYNFFIESFNNLISSLGYNGTLNLIHVLLPVGISFYTFQALSYTMDVYNKKISPEKDFFRYALFVAFFPQLVAGPIEKASHLLPQFRKKKMFVTANFINGVNLMLWGYFKKVVISDRLAIVVNTVYNAPKSYEGIPLIIATVFFAFQIYCDFSAYSDIARGCAKIMGYDLMLNFRTPYFSKSIREFWRRWHISLGAWFKEYLYIPLGGNKKGIKKMLLNIFVVFTISGLWHGASWTFIVWGVLHSIYQIVETLNERYSFKFSSLLGINKDSIMYSILTTVWTFVLVDFAWIFFRANTLDDALYVIKHMFKYSRIDFTSQYLGLEIPEFQLSIFLIVFLMISEFLYEKIKREREFFVNEGIYSQVIMMSISMVIILVFGFYGNNVSQQFIYFQF